jgi:LysR family transcriptional regulator, regulator for bpeEF and oprC
MLQKWNNRMNLNLLRTFSKVVELKSFTKAAQALALPKSRVSRAVARLEDDLGVSLIRRSTRLVAPTELGIKLYHSIEKQLHSIENAIHLLTEVSSKLSGTIRVSAPEDFGLSVLYPLMDKFQDIYPEIRFELIQSNTFLDLNFNDIDVTFRIGKLKDSTLIQKKVASVSLVLAAGTEYLSKNGHPRSLEDLKSHRIYGFFSENNLSAREDLLKQFVDIETHSTIMSCNSFSLLKQIAESNKGIVILPDFFFSILEKKGGLERVLPSKASKKSNIHLIYPSSRNLLQRTRTFIDFVSQEISHHTIV